MESGANKAGNSKESDMETKPFYLSKTLWFNLLSIVVIVAGVLGFGEFEMDPTVQAAVVAVINLLLRLYTDRPIGMKNGS